MPLPHWDGGGREPVLHREVSGQETVGCLSAAGVYRWSGALSSPQGNQPGGNLMRLLQSTASPNCLPLS